MGKTTYTAEIVDPVTQEVTVVTAASSSVLEERIQALLDATYGGEEGQPEDG